MWADQSEAGSGNMSRVGGRSAAEPLDKLLQDIAATVQQVLLELMRKAGISSGQMVVIGTSTSEVAGFPIGTSGSEKVAAEIFEGVRRAREQQHFYPVFQCCEHLNRALVTERQLLLQYPALEPVAVVPVPRAGGAMASYAYRNLAEPVVLEAVQAHGGLDIGNTLIGMHLRPVAVPLRPSVSMLGHAHMQMAYSRPRYIGGERAVYRLEAEGNDSTCT